MKISVVFVEDLQFRLDLETYKEIIDKSCKSESIKPMPKPKITIKKVATNIIEPYKRVIGFNIK